MLLPLLPVYSDGLGFGYNARAALITRGLVEMTRIGLAKGAEERTFMGLSGMGDLVLTCTGDLSRNRSVGLEIGRGRKAGRYFVRYENGRGRGQNDPIGLSASSASWGGNSDYRANVSDFVRKQRSSRRGCRSHATLAEGRIDLIERLESI